MDKIIQRRFSMLGAVVILMAFAIVWRMFEKQVVEHDQYVALAEGQQRYEQTELAQRGRIYVHDSIEGENSVYPLAFDVKSYALWVVPKHLKDKGAVAKKISQLSGISEAEVFGKINNDNLYIPPIKRGLDYDLATKISREKITGVFVMPEYSRYYPENNLAGQVLGFVNAEGKGNYGFEGHYDNELQGTAGKVTGEKDTLGRVISLLDQKDAKDGTSYVLSIDRSVQFFVEQKLAEAMPKYQAESGSIVIIDIKKGGVLAMASTPNYNPNDYKNVAKTNQNLFINPAIASLYEPGSVFKPITMAAALDTGAVTPETQETFGNFINVDGFEIHTAEDKAFGLENMGQIILNSDNVGMVWVADKLGKENMYKYIEKFGFMDKTGIDLDGETPSNVPILKNWRNIHRATISFGQGISVTPIALTSAYATLANGGKYLYPHVVDELIDSDGNKKEISKKEGEQIIKPETAKQINEMLVNTIKGGHGKQAGVQGYEVAGKTGTAQIPKAGGGYEENLYNHTYAGFAPANDPRFAMIVKLDKPKSAKYAESTAAPVWGEIASFLLNYYYRIPATN